MANDPLKDDFTDADDTRVLHANHHNELADRINIMSAKYDEGAVGMPAGGERDNALTVQNRKVPGWEGTQQVTPGGVPGMVQTLVSKNPNRWDWRVPDSAKYPNAAREGIDDEDNFGPLQGFMIVDEEDPIEKPQWGENGSLWLVYDPETEV